MNRYLRIHMEALGPRIEAEVFNKVNGVLSLGLGRLLEVFRLSGRESDILVEISC